MKHTSINYINILELSAVCAKSTGNETHGKQETGLRSAGWLGLSSDSTDNGTTTAWGGPVTCTGGGQTRNTREQGRAMRMRMGRVLAGWSERGTTSSERLHSLECVKILFRQTHLSISISVSLFFCTITASRG